MEAHGYMDFFEGGDSLSNGDSPKYGVCLHMVNITQEQPSIEKCR